MPSIANSFFNCIFVVLFIALSTASEWTQNHGPIPQIDEIDENATTIETEFYGTTFHTVVDLREFNNCTDTAAVNLSGFTWRVLVCRTYEQNTNLDLFLIANFNNPRWSVEAQAIFEIRKNGNDPNNYFRNSMEWKTFTADNPSHVIRNFLMSTHLADYVADGKIRLKIEITTKPAQPIEIEEIMQNTATKIRFLVKNVTSLTNEIAFLSSEVNLLGIRWNVAATKLEEHFAVSINAHPEDLSAVWSIDAKVTIKMMPANKPGRNIQPLTIDKDLTFVQDTPSHKFKLLSWDAIIHPDSNYAMKDTVALLVDIKTSPKKRVILFKS